MANSEHKSNRNVIRRRIVGFVLLLPLLVLALIVIERLRGQWGLKAWARETMSKGEHVEICQLWPQPSTEAIAFTNALQNIVSSLPKELLNYSGEIVSIVTCGTNKWTRGSQQIQPVFRGNLRTNTWEDLRRAVRAAQPALEGLRRLMRHAPDGATCDFMAVVRGDTVPSFVHTRVCAQALQAAAMCELHDGDLPAALANLEAIEGFVLNAQDPTFVHLMVRIAVLGIAVDLLWDALQAEGWSEQQLASMQSCFEQNRSLLPQLPRALEGEGIAHTADIEWFRTHSYSTCIERYEPIMRSFGVTDADFERAVAPRKFRERIFHPVWSFAWADQEKLRFLTAQEKDVAAVRHACAGGSLCELQSELAANRNAYKPPFCAWRFYLRLPLRDEIPDSNWRPVSPYEYPYVDFGRAWSSAFQNLTLNEMAIAVIAIKRFELRHGQPPAALAALLPEILTQVPRDFMVGEALKYRTAANGNYTLYSAGGYFRDDGGNIIVRTHDNAQRSDSPWNGADLVWR